MVAFEFNPLLHTILVLASAFLPGIALGWPLLKKAHHSDFEKILLSGFFGMFIVPIALFLEGLAGIGYSYQLLLANILLLTVAGAVWGVKTKAFSAPKGFSLPKMDWEWAVGTARTHGPSALLLLAMVLSFWIRIQTFSPIYSELDPYFYVYGTSQIIRDGMVPLSDDTSWWPEAPSTHRTSPLKMYLEAEWYSLYTQGGAYDNYLLFTTSSWLPPISAAFVCLGAYFLVSSIYGRRYGAFAAFMMAFLPSTIYKMSAGVNEAGPVGMMMLFMALGSLAVALVKKDRHTAAMAGFVFFVAIAASNIQTAIVPPFVALVVLLAAESFLRGKHDRSLSEAAICVAVGTVLGNFLVFGIYLNGGLVKMLNVQFVLPIVAALFALAVDFGLKRFKMTKDSRLAFAAGAAVIFAALFFLTPLGNVVRGPLGEYLGAVEFKTSLERTIAEQNLAGDSFEGEGGIAALIPKNRIVEGADDPGIVGQNLAYGALDLLVGGFWIVPGLGDAGNALVGLMDATFSFLLGQQFATGAKIPSLWQAFFFCAVAGLAARHARSAKESDGAGHVALLILLAMAPMLYIGINKIKFTVYAGMMMALAASCGMAEVERLVSFASRKLRQLSAEKYVPVAFSLLLLATTIAHAAGPIGYAKFILFKSFDARYQDNPELMAPKMAKLCEDLRQRGVDYAQISTICSAGYDKAFADTMDGQFNYDVCVFSQLSTGELFPTQDTASQTASAEAVTGARFRCNRLGDYWVDSMEWIKNNLGDNDRVTSWWDYGHWTNYLGDRKTVLRNEHASTGMIGRIAHDYIIGSTEDLVKSMNYFDSRYALFDVELIGGSSFGGKYGALNYLGCVHEGEATLAQSPGSSQCELDHSPERIAVPRAAVAGTGCTISESQQRTGVVAVRLDSAVPDLTRPDYCIGEVTLSTGETISAMYDMNKRDANGDLALNRGFLRPAGEDAGAQYFEVVYNDAPVWPDGSGGYGSGYADAKTKFYTSNLYKAFYLEKLEGFDLVYKSKNGEVKIYRLKEFTGNPKGTIDQAYAGRAN